MCLRRTAVKIVFIWEWKKKIVKIICALVLRLSVCQSMKPDLEHYFPKPCKDPRPILLQFLSFKIRRTTFLSFIKFADLEALEL